MTSWADIQRRVGVDPDGIPGPATMRAVARALGISVDARGARSLQRPPAFFDTVRGPLFAGSLKPDQVRGTQALLAAVGTAGWSLAWAAYGLATAYWETARTMQPVREAFHLSEDWRRRNLRYFPHYGRGYVQLTWPANYERADRELGLGGKLIADLDLAMDCDIAARILVRGMEEGWFAGDDRGRHTLARHLPAPEGSFEGFRAARRIINGTDKAADIAQIAVRFQDALRAGGWS